MGRGGGEEGEAPPTSFSPVTSTNVGISPQNFLILLLTLLTDCCKISSLYLVQSQIIELEPSPPLKKSGFSGQILVILN